MTTSEHELDGLTGEGHIRKVYDGTDRKREQAHILACHTENAKLQAKAIDKLTENIEAAGHEIAKAGKSQARYALILALATWCLFLATCALVYATFTG